MNRSFITATIFLLILGGVVFWFSQEVNRILETSSRSSAKPSISQEVMADQTLKPVLETPPENTLPLEAQKIMQQIFARFNAGDYGAALKLAEAALENTNLHPDLHTWINAQMPAILVSAGWLEIKLGRCDTGFRMLRRANAYKKTPEAAKGMAYCAYKQRDFMTADEQFPLYLKDNPKDMEMSLIYADLLESDFRFNEAAKILEAAKALDANNELLDKKLQAMRARAKESKNQMSLEADVFRLTYRSPDHDDFVDEVLEVLVVAKDEYIERYRFLPPKAMIEVILYPQSDFKNVAGGPDWAEGIFDGRMRIPIKESFKKKDDFETLKRVLRHELVHAMLALMLDYRELPPWFNEGLAQRLECESDCKRNIFGSSPGNFLNLESFFLPYTSYEHLKADLSYRQSLYLIYVLEKDEHYLRDDTLAELISLLPQHKDLSSDSIVEFLKTDFAGVYGRARGLWAARVPF